MRTLFAEFTQAVDKKVAAVMADPLEKPLAKSLQRGEDAHFDQVNPSNNAGEGRISFQIAMFINLLTCPVVLDPIGIRHSGRALPAVDHENTVRLVREAGS